MDSENKKGSIGFPTKYAVMGLKKLDSQNKSEEIYAYTAAHCYLIKEIKEYYSTSQPENKCEVVFEWNQEGEEEITPQFNDYNVCLNSIIVDKVFDRIEDAHLHAEEKNEELYMKKVNKLTEEITNDKENAYKLGEQHINREKIKTKIQKYRGMI